MDAIPLGIYRHYKGNQYEVIGFAKHSETLEDMVIYKALYGEGGIWVRPLSMWGELVETDGEAVRRFEYVDFTAENIVSKSAELFDGVFDDTQKARIIT